MSMALVNPVEAFADRIYDYLATNEQFLRWGSRECVAEAFRLVFGGDYGATEEAAEVLRGVAEGALLPRFVLVADSPYAATWVVAERRGGRYVEYARVSKRDADDLLARLERSGP